MEFPITVTKIEVDPDGTTYRPRCLTGGTCGSWVSVRPCFPEAGGRTYLGVLLGELAALGGAQFNRATGTLRLIGGLGNPAIYVPDLKRVVMGYESWWGLIRSPDDLRRITDADIQDVWYVRALRELSAAPPDLDQPDPLEEDRAEWDREQRW